MTSPRNQKIFEILNHSPVMVFVWDNKPGWPVLLVTENVSQYLGYEAREFVEGEVAYEQLLHPEDRKRVENEVRQNSADPSVESFFHEPYRIRDRFGNVRWIQDMTRIIRGADKKVERYEGVVLDITDRKEMEQRLKLSEEMFRKIYENLSVGLAQVSLDFTIMEANDAYHRMLGYEPGELRGVSLWEITDKQVLRKNKTLQENLARGDREHFRLQKRFLHKNGDTVYGILDANLIRDAQGKPSYFLGSVVDITQQHRAQELNRLQTWRAEALLGLEQDSGLQDEKAFLKRCKTLATELTKSSYGALHLLHDPFHKGYRPPAGNSLCAKAVETGKAVVCNQQCTDTEFERFATVPVLQQDEVVMLLCAGNKAEEYDEFDVETLQLIANTAYRLLHKKRSDRFLQLRLEYEEIISSISSKFVGVYDLDERIEETLGKLGHLTRSDRAYMFLIDARRGEMYNTHEWCAHGVPSQKQQLQNLSVHDFPWWLEHLEKNRTIFIPRVEALPAEAESEKRILRQQKISSCLAYPLYSKAHLIGFIGFDNFRMDDERWLIQGEEFLKVAAEIIANALDRFRFEKQLHQKDEMLIAQSRHAAMGEMISMIAHQWRQPLSVIGMGANNVLADIELESLDPEQLAQMMRDILRQTQYLSQTIDDFRDFFKPKKQIETMEFKQLCKELYSIMGKSLEHSDVTLRLQLEKGLLITTYSRELLQVLINIVKNAKEALLQNRKANRQIRLRAYIRSGQLHIVICDNGGGIDPAIREQIYDPYFTTKDENIGTGLGLYMSRSIVEKHLKGSIETYNLDEGACFELILPADQSSRSIPH